MEKNGKQKDFEVVCNVCGEVYKEGTCSCGKSGLDKCSGIVSGESKVTEKENE